MVQPRRDSLVAMGVGYKRLIFLPLIDTPLPTALLFRKLKNAKPEINSCALYQKKTALISEDGL